MNDLPTTKETTNKIVSLLKTTPEALKAFEEAYRVHALEQSDPSDPFGISAMQAKEETRVVDITTPVPYDADALERVCDRIVDELLAKTRVWTFDGTYGNELSALGPAVEPVTREELLSFPAEVRPQLTGDMTTIDADADAGMMLLQIYARHLQTTDHMEKQMLYHQFRQGLDILDIDPLVYAMLGTNPNSMSHWLPAISEAAVHCGFFKVPVTTVILVPPSLLQMTRLDYGRLNQTTRRIVNAYCMKAFRLDPNKDYFVKTGIYSSKFDFRNCRVTAGKEVTELGEYLLYISNQAVKMAGPLTTPCIYGMSTTNEWAVREYIHDVEDAPCIYKGLPLHTEYRVFADFDKGEVIGAAPYWDAGLMKSRFAKGATAGSPHDAHDYVVYLAHEETLRKRYDRNIVTIVKAVRSLAKYVRDEGTLTGQWSIDIMQNGDDFWLIDMALAQNSALYGCVPIKLRAPTEENWLPNITAASDGTKTN